MFLRPGREDQHRQHAQFGFDLGFGTSLSLTFRIELPTSWMSRKGFFSRQFEVDSVASDFGALRFCFFPGRGPEVLVTTFSIAKRGDTSRTYFLKIWFASVQFLLAMATEPLFVKISTPNCQFLFDLIFGSRRKRHSKSNAPFLKCRRIVA